MKAGLPTLVIGGYLGAGKTSLVNHLLRAADGVRIAVLVNDFGELEIDAALITGQSGDVISLAGGCVCCSFGSDLVGALNRLVAAASPPDLILIETSGVALPGAVARSARLAQGIALSGIAVLADAQDVRERAADRYVHDTVCQQLTDADLLLLNKTDLVEPDALAQTRTWLATLAPGVPVLDVQDGALAPELLLGLVERRASIAPSPREDLAGTAWASGVIGEAQRAQFAHRNGTPFESRAYTSGEAVDVPALVQALLRLPGLLRAKGFVTDRVGQGHLLQMVARRYSLQPWDAAPGMQLVLIGLSGSLPVELPLAMDGKTL